MNKLNKLSASHGAVLFLFRSLFQLAKVIFSSKRLTKSSTKILPFHYLFSRTKILLRVQVFRLLWASAAQALDKQLSEVSNTHSK